MSITFCIWIDCAGETVSVIKWVWLDFFTIQLMCSHCRLLCTKVVFVLDATISLSALIPVASDDIRTLPFCLRFCIWTNFHFYLSSDCLDVKEDLVFPQISFRHFHCTHSFTPHNYVHTHTHTYTPTRSLAAFISLIIHSLRRSSPHSNYWSEKCTSRHAEIIWLYDWFHLFLFF